MHDLRKPLIALAAAVAALVGALALYAGGGERPLYSETAADAPPA